MPALTISILHPYITSMADFDYSASAEVYAGRSMRRAGSMKYRRFDTGAEAVRYAIEVMPPSNLPGAVLEANEKRYGHQEIRKLYDAAEYPLKRKEPSSLPAPKADQTVKI